MTTASLNSPPLAAFDRPAADSPLPQLPAGPQSQEPGAAVPAAAPAAPEVDLKTPFADWDWTWLNGNPRNKDTAFDSKFFTPEIRADLTYTYDFNRPSDDSMGGSSELFRSNEIQLEQLGIGGDFHWDNVRARFMTQFGKYSTATIRNDASYAKGQWNLADADRYLSEAYGGYHINECTESTSMRESSCPTSVCSATTTSITGPTSPPTFPPTRPGFSRACEYRFSPRTI